MDSDASTPPASIRPLEAERRFRPPAGVVLAAGSGQRFGGAKALIELQGRLLVERALDIVRSAGCEPCVVVLGAQAGRVRREADTSGALVVEATDWARGQSASLRAGFDALGPTGAPAVVVALVDQPLVTPAAVRRLVRAWRSGATVAAATYGGRLRTPVLFDLSVWAEVLSGLAGDRGAGPWLRAHPDRVTRVEVGDIADDVDIDRPADLLLVRQQLRPV